MRARAGLPKASFIAKADLHSLRHIAGQRQKLGGMLSSAKTQLHKLLTDAGMRLGVVVSDLNAQSARASVKSTDRGQKCARSAEYGQPSLPSLTRQPRS